MKRKSFVGILMVMAAVLVLAGCAQPEGRRWVPEERAGQAVISGNVRFTDGHVQSATVRLLEEDARQRTFVLDGASGNFSEHESWESDGAEELALPMTAADMERFAEVCRQWMLEEYAQIAVFDVSFAAEKTEELPAQTAQTLLSSVGSGPPITYSIAGARLAETDGPGLTENALGLGSITAPESEGRLSRTVILVP